MTARISRRVALKVLGVGAALPLGVMGLRTLRGVPEPVQWNGTALGALAGMTLWHPDPDVARRAIRQMLVEVDRLENIFSLYRPHSEIAQLNRAGRLDHPSRDMVDLMVQSQRIADFSAGAFDPTIQPLWEHYATATQRGGDAGEHSLGAALARVDYTAVSATRRGVNFGKPNMRVSLNGIAQGYITDRITEILGNEGFETAVIDLGETRALGSAPDGQPFPIGLISPTAPNTLDRELPLANAALSVSGGYGLQLDDFGTQHILDPKTGATAHGLVQVAVVSPRATWADALSTAIYVSGEGMARPLLDAYPGSTALLYRSDGSTVSL